MNSNISSLLVAASLLFSGATFAAAETGDETPPASQQKTQEASDLDTQPLPPAKPARFKKSGSLNSPRAKDLDLRHCLELSTNAAIAECAGE